mgnify:CR=1 FL=1
MRSFQKEVMMSMWMINQLSFYMNQNIRFNREEKNYILKDIKKFENQSLNKDLNDEKLGNLSRLLKQGKMSFEWVEWVQTAVKTQQEISLRNDRLLQNMTLGMTLLKSLISSQVQKLIQSMFLTRILSLMEWKILLDNLGIQFRENRK